MAGLLHDIGLLVLSTNFPEQYSEVLANLRHDRLSVCDAERAVFKASHEDVGAYLLGLWGVSDAIVEAVAFHHHPGERFQDGFSLLAAVHVANALEETSDPTTTRTSAPNRTLTSNRCPRGSAPTIGAIARPAASHAVAIQKMPSWTCQVRATEYGRMSASGIP